MTLVLAMAARTQSLDQNITVLANDIAQKIAKKNKTRLALTDFVNNEGKVDAVTDYIREELELKLINADDLQVIDRKHIKLLLSENKLQSEGLIDESTAKSAVSFIKVDGWVIAEITTLGDQIKIKIKVIDVTTSQIYAASTSELISDAAIQNLLNPPIKICSECGGKGVVQEQTTCSACEGVGSFRCKSCGGTGQLPGMWVGSYKTCEGCGGKGKINCNVCTGKGKIISYKTCPKCNGKLQLTSGTGTAQAVSTKVELCPECGGSGKLKQEVTCTSCSGSGEAPFGPASNWERKPCSSCSGKGKKVISSKCPTCNGSGKIN